MGTHTTSLLVEHLQHDQCLKHVSKHNNDHDRASIEHVIHFLSEGDKHDYLKHGNSYMRNMRVSISNPFRGSQWGKNTHSEGTGVPIP